LTTWAARYRLGDRPISIRSSWRTVSSLCCRPYDSDHAICCLLYIVTVPRLAPFLRRTSNRNASRIRLDGFHAMARGGIHACVGSSNVTTRSLSGDKLCVAIPAMCL
jgi:hypothetical protein